MPNKTRWTPDQEDAIRARGGSLIVTAAAGSGKTAVLVERVSEHLTDPENPTDADRLLIVTFTKAATSEMRSRLAKRIDEMLRDDPGNDTLQRQKMLLPTAAICTIDSFCGSLIREHFQQLDLDPDFRMLDDAESRILQHAAVRTVLDEYYESEDPVFRRLADLLISGRDDAPVEETILKLYTYSRSYPSPDTWLNQAVREYDREQIRDGRIVSLIVRNTNEMLDFVLKKSENALRAFRDVGLDDDGITCYGFLKNENALIRNLRSCVEKRDFKGALDLVDKEKDPFPRWKNPTKGELKSLGQESLTSDQLEAVAYAKDLRANVIKNNLDLKALARYLPASLEETEQDCADLGPLAEKLVEAVRRFDAQYRLLKRNEGALDFSDAALYALSLLVEDPGAETPVFTELAKDLSLQYDEILIDECQDINRAQDLIFRAISREESNLFMVGDVKQSIYQFRQASPELFLSRQDAYPRYDRKIDAYPAKVILGRNFRSREGILAAVNFAFRQLMSRRMGDLDYNKDEMLYFGRTDFPEREEPDTELHLLTLEKDSTRNAKEQEAEYLAAYILHTMEEQRAKGNEIHFKDFAILMQSPRNCADLYKNILSRNGIPVYTDLGGGFLDTADVQVILSLLRVIDNPRQDVPLLAVMLSPLYGFTPDELAKIRIPDRKQSLYAAVLRAREQGDEKCRRFVASLERYRRYSVALSSGDLLRQIYDETAFVSLAEAMPNGYQRAANLHKLLTLADQHDAYSTFGLAGFLRQIDRMAESGVDPDAASTLSPNADVVKIMSIHKSKGLQFPYCILANTGHKFNDTDEKSNLILHPDLGIGLKGRDPKTGNTYPTLFHAAIRQDTKRRAYSEYLRVLYVAMTRAEQKLVLLVSDKEIPKTVEKMVPLLSGEPALDPFAVQSCNCFSKWLLLAFLRHPYVANKLKYGKDDRTCKALSLDVQPLKVVCESSKCDENEAEKDELEIAVLPPEAIEQKDALLTRIAYAYPYETLTVTPAKRTASSLEDPEFSTRYFARTKPQFLSQGRLTPSQRGTAQHKFMQFADFAAAESDPEAELQRLTDAGLLSEEEAAVVSLSEVRGFFASGLYVRLKASPNVMREQQFAVLLPAGEFDATLTGEAAGEPVLVQGVVDAAFEEDGAVVVLDYKTDRVKEGETLVSRYTGQLRVYAKAMEEISGLPVKELTLYSFALGKEVPVPRSR